jgi:hypothetical protein
MSHILANIVQGIHLLIAGFILFAPLSNMILILMIHFVSVISLITHWKMNSNMCFLTLLEGYIRGTPRQNTFMYSVIAPVYNISSTQWGEVVTIITLILGFISLTKILALINLEVYDKNLPLYTNMINVLDLKPTFTKS